MGLKGFRTRERKKPLLSREAKPTMNLRESKSKILCGVRIRLLRRFSVVDGALLFA